MSIHYTTPEPEGGPAYSDPLEKWLGEPVLAEWAGKEIKGIVTGVELDTTRLCFSGELIIEPRDTDARIRVDPEHAELR